MCFPLELYPVFVIPRTGGYVNISTRSVSSPVSSLVLQDLELEEDLKQGENLGSASIHEREREKGAAPGSFSQKKAGRRI